MKIKLSKLAAVFMLALGCTISTVSVAYSATYKEYTAPDKFIQLYETNVNIDFLGQAKEYVNGYFYNNRLCLPIRQTVTNLGGTLTTDEANENFVVTINDTTKAFPIKPSDGNRVTTLYVNGTGYIYIYDLLEAFSLTPSFDIDSNTITIYKKTTAMTDDLLTNPGVDKKSAYLRLEDITANGLDYSDPRYSDKRLEKLRTMAEYLYLRGQEYYIAWIPYYSNPGYSVWNDLTDNTNLYNSCFMYTLDYMVDHGGHLGVHGYTHQYGLSKSADGYEWGANTPYSVEEQQNRMIKAKQTAERLGFTAEFFEFPHYGATAQQMEMAEQYFDVIYQAHPTSPNKITKITNKNGYTAYYVPTPADYVYSSLDLNGALNRLKNSIAKNQEVSIFYHPVLDLDKITYTISEDYEKSWFVSSNCILTSLVNQIISQGYTFTELKLN